MSIAHAVRTVAVLPCGSSEHAERGPETLPSKADTTIWQVCLKCILTFILHAQKEKKSLFFNAHETQKN